MNYTWSEPFVKGTIFTLPSFSSSAVIGESGYKNSTLNMTIYSWNGNVFGDGNMLNMNIWVNISGYLAPNLLASGYVFNQSVSAPKGALKQGVFAGIGGIFPDFAPQYGWNNTSFHVNNGMPAYATYTGIPNDTSLSFNVNINNETSGSGNSSKLFHFSSWFQVEMTIYGWNTDPSWEYNLGFNLTLLGLPKDVYVQVELTMHNLIGVD